MKKNDKTKILFILLLFSMLLTWFVAGGSYNNDGVFELAKMTRAGIYDIVIILFYSVYYNITNVFFLLLIGGSYGILSKTKSYRKLVDKTVNLVKGRENLFFALTTLLTGLFVSITSNAIVVFAFVPFIVTVFLKTGHSRISAISAALGGIFIGMIGNTFGSFGVSNMLTQLGLTYKKGIGYKIAIFAISYILYNLFGILHINKEYKEVNENEYNPYDTEKLDEPKIKRKKTKLWPIITLGVILCIVTVLGYIDWSGSFNIGIFDKIEKGFESFKIRGIPVLYNLAGSTSAFGKWEDTLAMGTILLFTTIIISLIDKNKIDDLINNFTIGMKDIVNVLIPITLTYSIFIVLMWYGWPYTLVNAILGSGKFNLFTLFLAGLVIGFFAVDKNYIGYTLGAFIATTFTGKAIASSLIMNSSSSIMATIAPTSIILIYGLSLLDIPYKDWLKYIWKYILAIIIAVLILFSIMCYM